MIGLYWGRFNPPHKGHLQLIKKILKEVDIVNQLNSSALVHHSTPIKNRKNKLVYYKLIIAIGSAEFKNTKRNPFDGNERKKMIEAYLKEEKINMKKVKVIAIPDGKSFSSGIKNLFELCGDFDVLYTDKETIIKLIEKRVKVKRIRRRGTISSTQIRDAIASDERWEHLTGKSVAQD